MKKDRSRYYGHRFPPEIISYAVWVYHRFCLSFRDVEDLLAERGVTVSYEAIRLWCQKFGLAQTDLTGDFCTSRIERLGYRKEPGKCRRRRSRRSRSCRSSDRSKC